MNQSLEQIAARNHTKELDKAWETSWTRRLAIAVITYLSALLFLIIIAVPNPYLAALVPVGGFILSTLTLRPLKKCWLTHQSKK